MSGSSAVCPDCGTPLKGGGSEGMCVVCLLGAGASLAMRGGRPRAETDPEFPIEFGEYDLLAEIGHGGSGRVFSARHRKLGRQVAVKILAGGGLASSRDFGQRFLNEARAAARLDHPFIVPVYEVGEQEGQSFLAMRLLEGGSLARRLAKEPRVFADSDRASRFIITLSRAVHFAHQHGVLHRDLKPGNVLLDSAGQPFVTDFGLARLTEQESTLTQTNALLGTPGYMAPEQARGGVAVTTAADVYGIGAVFYEILTGLPPFAGGTTYETVQLLLNTEPRRPSAVVPGLDRDLETICLKCLSKEPAARYASAEAVADDLDRHLRGEPIRARPVSAAVRFQKWVLRHRTVSLISAAAVGLLVGGVILLALTNAKLQQAQRTLAQQTNAQRRDLIRLRVATGNRQMEDGDGYAALASYAEAASLESPAEPGFDVRLAEHAWRFSSAQALLPDQQFSWKHEGPVYGLAFSADDRRLITASADRTARMFDTVSGAALTPPLPHGAPVWSVAFADGDRKVITRTRAGEVQLWQADSGAPAAGPFPGRKAMDWLDGLDAAVPVSPDSRLFAVLLPDAVQLRKTSDGLPQGAPIPCGDQPNSAAFTSDGRRLAVLCEKGKGLIFDLTVEPPRKLDTEFQSKTGWRIGRWSADDQRLAMTDCHFSLSAPIGGVIPEPQLFAHGSMVLGLEWTNKSSRLLTWSYDATVRFWDSTSAQPVLAVMRHQGPVFSAALSPDGSVVASGGHDGMARFWNALTGEHRGALLRHGGPVRKVLWSHDGRRLAVASDDGTARLWNTGASGARHDWNPDSGSPMQRTAFSPDGSRAVVLTLGNSAFIYDTAPGAKPPVVLPHPLRPLSAAWLDHNRLITACGDGTMREWNLPGETPVREWMREPLGTEPGQSDPEPTFSPDGRLMAFNPHSRPSFLYDSLSGKRVRQLGDTITYGLEWSPCGRFVMTVKEGSALVWEASTGSLVSKAKLPPHTNITVPDYGAKRLACISTNYAVNVIDAVYGRILAGPMAHGSKVYDAAFSADGRSLVTVAMDKNLRVWSAVTGEPLSPSVELSEYATSVTTHPGSRMFMAACNNGHAQIFDFPDVVHTVEEMRKKVLKSGSGQVQR